MSARIAPSLVVASLAVLAACGGPGPAPSPREETPIATPGSPAPTPAVELAVTVLVSGLEVPWDVAFTPSGRRFVTERDSGRVLEVLPGGRTREVHRFEVDATGEGGLLGLAASPTKDSLLYAYLTSAQDNRVVRFRPGSEPEPILTGIPKASLHDGGRIAFGPDGMLYVATGDATVPERAQDPRSLAGKILRLTPEGEVPEDNPIPGSPVWSLGHRNVQGLAWDAEGTMYATEFGPDRDDEINVIVPGGNYGWPEVTGKAGREEFIDPILVRQPPEASWSGAVVLVGSAIPQWEGDLFTAALRGMRLWRVGLGPGGDVTEVEELLVAEFGRLRHAAQAPDGSLWLLTSNRDGRGTPEPGDDRIVRLGPGG